MIQVPHCCSAFSRFSSRRLSRSPLLAPRRAVRLGPGSVPWRAVVKVSCVCLEMPLVFVEATGTASSGSTGKEKRKGKDREKS